MKRNEVVEEIKDFLVIRTDCSRSFGESLAQDILNILERKFGMAPVTKHGVVQEWEKEEGKWA